MLTRVHRLLVYKTDLFERWFTGLSDHKARARIQARVDRLALGHFGDVKPVGDGVAELRIFHGPGYRIYFVRRSARAIILLIGGDKNSQSKDIKRAKELARQLEVRT